MKIIILTVADTGGAGIAAYKLMRLFRSYGHRACLVVMKRSKNHDFTYQIQPRYFLLHKIWMYVWHLYLSRVETDANYYFFNKDERFSAFSASEIKSSFPFKPDYIIPLSISGFVNFKCLADLQIITQAKIYFWLADMGSFTGGCHYSWDCVGYLDKCKDCPALKPGLFSSLAYFNLRSRIYHAARGNFYAIAGSQWVGNQAKMSRIFSDQRAIFNTNSIIDFTTFNADNRSSSKSFYGIPEGEFVIFAAAAIVTEKRKGFRYLVKALKILGDTLPSSVSARITLLIAGDLDSLYAGELQSSLPFSIKQLGLLKNSNQLSLAYQASNVFVSPSIQDSGPMMVAESLASGTPVVAFKMGIANDLIVNGYNGFLCELFDCSQIANSIRKILNFSHSKFDRFSINSMASAHDFCSREFAAEALFKSFELSDKNF